MNIPCTTKREIRNALATPGTSISAVEFGNWDGQNGGEGETSSIVLHLGVRGSVEISATSYGKLKIEEC